MSFRLTSAVVPPVAVAWGHARWASYLDALRRRMMMVMVRSGAAIFLPPSLRNCTQHTFYMPETAMLQPIHCLSFI